MQSSWKLFWFHDHVPPSLNLMCKRTNSSVNTIVNRKKWQKGLWVSIVIITVMESRKHSAHCISAVSFIR